MRTCETSLVKLEVKPHFGLHRAGFTRSHVSLWASTSWFHMSSREHLCKLTWQVHVTKISELALVVCKNLRDFTEILYIVDWFLISPLAYDFSLMKMISRFQIWFHWFQLGRTRFHRVSDPSLFYSRLCRRPFKISGLAMRNIDEHQSSLVNQTFFLGVPFINWSS